MDIGGWDAVYGCSADVLNGRLAASREQFALEISDSVPLGSGLPDFKVQARFTDWRIVSGGAANHIVVEITSDGTAGNGLCYSGMRSRVRIALSFLQDSSTQGRIIMDCGPENVQMLDVDVGKQFCKGDDQRLMFDLIGDVYVRQINDNRSRLEFILAEITESGLKQSKYLWYEPINNSRAVGFLLVCGVFDDRDITRIPTTVDNRLLYDGNGRAYDIVFMASAEWFYARLMLPVLPALLPGSCRDNYRISGGRIVNNGCIPLSPIRSGAIDYQPYVSSFDFHIEDSSIVTRLGGRCPIKGLTDAYVDFSLTSKNHAVCGQTPGAIQFEKDPDLVLSVNKDIPSWEQWIGILSLGILNIVVDCISKDIGDAIAGRLSVLKADTMEIGLGAVRWGIDEPAKYDGGISDNIYIRYAGVKPVGTGRKAGDGYGT